VHNSLLRNVRQQLHAQIAEALIAHSPELMDSHPELSARHYAEAGLVEKSVAYWGRAGRRSTARSALAEAAAQFQQGLDQLARVPDNHERQRQELEFRGALAVALRFVKGQVAPETGQAYARALELWEQLGFPAEHLQVPYGHTRYLVYRGELNLAMRLSEDILLLSRQRNDSGGLVLGHQACGSVQTHTGRFVSARSNLEAALALYDPISHLSLFYQAAIHPQLVAQGYLGMVLLCLGYPDQALARSSAAVTQAREFAHLPSLAVTLGWSAMLSLVGGNTISGRWVDELDTIAAEQGFLFWRAVATIFRGWMKVKNGDVPGGLPLLRGGLEAYRAAGADQWIPYFFGLLARACEIAGQLDESLVLIDDALRIVERTGERWFEAELHRHKGQLLLRQGHSQTAEELYDKALSIAREQEAKLWELRAAMSFARLRRARSQRSKRAARPTKLITGRER